MAEEARLTIRIDPKKREALSQKAKQEGKNSTEILMNFIDRYLGISTKETLEERLSRVEKILEENNGESVAVR